jgi:hypothetical protein
MTERKGQEAQARRWLRMLVERCDGGVTIDLRLSLRSGSLACTIDPRRLLLQSGADVMAKTVPNDRDGWVISVAWALRAVGKRTAAVMLLRLVPAEKSSESSWQNVAKMTGLSQDDAKMVFKIGVPLFLAEIERRELETQYPKLAPLPPKGAGITSWREGDDDGRESEEACNEEDDTHARSHRAKVA